MKPVCKLLVILVFVGGFSLYARSLGQLYSADVCFGKAQDMIDEVEFEQALKYANCAVSKNFQEPRYYRLRAKVYLLLAAAGGAGGESGLTGSPAKVGTPMTAAWKRDVAWLKRAAFEDLLQANNLNPMNLVVIRNSVPLYYYLSIKDYSVPAGPGNYDEAYLGPAQTFFGRTKRAYAHDAGVVALLAKYENKLGLMDDYEESRQLVRELRPDLLEWHEAFR